MWKKWFWFALIGISLAVLFFPDKIETADMISIAPAGEQVFVVSTLKSYSRSGFSGGDPPMRNELRLLSDSGEISKPQTSIYGNIVNLTAFDNKLWLFWGNGGASTMDLNFTRGGIVPNQEATPALLPKGWTVPVEVATVHDNSLRIFGRKDNYIMTAAFKNGSWNEPETLGLPKASSDAPLPKALRENEQLVASVSNGKDRLLLVWRSPDDKREEKNTQRLGCGLVDFAAKQVVLGNPMTFSLSTQYSVYAGADGQFYCLQITPPPLLSQKGHTFKSFVFKNSEWVAETLAKEAFREFPAEMSDVAGWSSGDRDYLAIQSKNGPQIFSRQNNRWMTFGKAEAPTGKSKSGMLMFGVSQ